MKSKLSFFTVLCLLLGYGVTSANPGDTTIITAQTDLPMDFMQPHNYDSLVTLPDGSKSYRKILLEFSIGKYNCGGGYDPANPGEDSTQTGWCADWDYDMMVYAKTPTDTIELGRVITPYGNSTMTRTPADWKHPYYFDVTDLYPILKNDVTLTIRYNAWYSGWTGSVRLLFIEGTPPRDVVKVSPLWTDSYSYGDGSNPIDDQVTQLSEQFPANALSASFRLFITGHGMDQPHSCAEFCSKWYQFKINGNNVLTHDIWRDDCGDNFLYPQSGTWIYNRANWCPGDLVRLITHDVPATVTPGSNYNIDLDFQPYTSTAGSASYKLGAAVVYYADFNKSLDAGIEDIISPTNNETHFRHNPICGSPEIEVKNLGSTPITSIEFEYGVAGETLSTYTHSTQLPPLESQHILLPPIESIGNASANTNTFIVRILSVNGQVDEDPYNNELKSEFEPVLKWEGGQFAVNLKMSSSVSNYVNRAYWKISDLSGNVVAERNGTIASESYSDTLHLNNGCYRLELDCSYLGIGLRNPYFMLSSSSGYLRIYDLRNGDRLAIPAHDIGPVSAYQGPQEGWVGNGFTTYFQVFNSLDIADRESPVFKLDVFPNPANEEVTLRLRHKVGNDPIRVSMVNSVGQLVYQRSMTENEMVIPVGHLASGIYSLSCQNSKGIQVEKVVISH